MMKKSTNTIPSICLLFIFPFVPIIFKGQKSFHLPRLLLLLIVFQIISSVPLFSQSTPINYTGWYGFENYNAFKKGKPWGLMGEGFWIRDNVILHQNALFIRAGLNYYLKSGNRLNGGVAYQYNFPYDASSQPYDWPDYRLFQQYLIRLPKAKGMWQFRFRIEERWLGRKTDPTSHSFDHYKYETSIICMVKKSFNLSKKFYAVVYDEVWLLLSKPDRLLDQNRFYLGMGMNLDEEGEWRLEAGYMNQPNFDGSPETTEKSRINHALRVTLAIDAPFSK